MTEQAIPTTNRFGFQQRMGQLWDSQFGRQKGLSTWLGDHVARQVTPKGQVPATFGSVGEMIAGAPLRRLATSGLVGLGFTGVLDYGLGGKEFNRSNVFETLSSTAAFTLSGELAGGGLMGMAKGIGWGVGGGLLGLGPWQTLGVQFAAGVNPLIGVGLMSGMAAYNVGKGLWNHADEMASLGARSRFSAFQQNTDRSIRTQEAATMRQRSLGAIQKSQFSMRQVLGQEAAILGVR